MDPYIIGNLLGVVLIFGWIPYKCYYTGKFVASALTNAFQGETRPEPSKKDPLPPRTKKPKKLKVVKQEIPARKPKNSYPTVSSYNEEHRITNPVEFDA
tara:strand:+ start:54 stop:350 length:297 start_codon:yes stop_codon:yes gene_type:complete